MPKTVPQPMSQIIPETMSETIPKTMSPILYQGDFIQGAFIKPSQPNGEWHIHSPADFKDRVIDVKCAYEHIDTACEAASKAYKPWQSKDTDRNSYLLRLKKVYEDHKEQLAEVISRETGKPLWESLSEAKAMVGKIDITLNHSMNLVGEERVENALPHVDGFIRHRPRGVMAVIGPFNFPGHLPNGHFVPALATGNTIVFKPSDKTPAVGQLIAEMFKKAEFPPGVFNLVQGQAETGRRLVGHEKVDGVLFTGSYDVGLKIQQETLQHHWKILALEMGGKNCSVVWRDADLNKAVYENILGAYLSTGQRCSCTSKIILHKDIKDAFVDKFHETAKKIKVGHWSEKNFMGPIISEYAMEKYLRFQEIAQREDCELLMRGKVLELTPQGHYVTPSIALVKKHNPDSVYQKSEIFGPNVGIYEIEDIEEAVEINNSSGFGLAMSVFSKDRSIFEQVLAGAKVGILNWNRTTNGASSRLPFGGLGKSGNDRPSAHYAVQYCTSPVASLEDTNPFAPGQQQMPGIDYSPMGD